MRWYWGPKQRFIIKEMYVGDASLQLNRQIGADWGWKSSKKKKKRISPTLNNDRWIGRGGPTVWPPRSPDLTPMDYFLLGHIKALIYVTSLFWRWYYCLYCWGKNLALLSAQVVLCCVALRCVLRSVPVRLNICSKLLRNVTFVLYIIKWFCFISNLSHTQFDGPTAKNHLRHTVSSQ